MKHDAATLFSFGYWGWGTSTAQLVQAFDALERSRGFNPPILVDIRISRSVRAPGFNNRALEDMVGSKRYHHLKKLGNRAVMDRRLETITIADPSAAGDLLDLSLEARSRNQRIVFFCACPYQKQDGEIYCHRYEVGSLLLANARRRNESITVTEWPGTIPQVLTIPVQVGDLKKLRRGMKSVLLPRDIPLDRIASIAWGSVANCRCEGDSINVRVDRAKWSANGWYLPVLTFVEKTGTVASDRERSAWGFEERRPEALSKAR